MVSLWAACERDTPGRAMSTTTDRQRSPPRKSARARRLPRHRSHEPRVAPELRRAHTGRDGGPRALVLRDVPALLTGQMRCLRMAFARAPPVAPSVSVAHAK